MTNRQTLLEMHCSNAKQFYKERQNFSELLYKIKDFKNLQPSMPY